MATTYLTPGVYVEEVPSGSATLAPGATAVAAFVGFTAKGPKDDPSDPLGQKPRLVSNWTQFEQLYGGEIQCEKGGAWLLERHGAELVPTEYLAPPAIAGRTRQAVSSTA